MSEEMLATEATLPKPIYAQRKAFVSTHSNHGGGHCLAVDRPTPVARLSQRDPSRRSRRGLKIAASICQEKRVRRENEEDDVLVSDECKKSHLFDQPEPASSGRNMPWLAEVGLSILLGVLELDEALGKWENVVESKNEE